MTIQAKYYFGLWVKRLEGHHLKKIVLSSYLKVFYKDKEFFNQRADYEELISEGYLLSFNINFYIDKDYNSNGMNELFIDSGYTTGNNWFEHYYFFEYDNNSIKLVKDFIASDWTQRLGLSDHFKEKFEMNKKFKKPSKDEKKALENLVLKLSEIKENLKPEELQTIVYATGKENGYEQNLRDWFKLIYEVVFGEENGPRMGYFVSFFGLKETIELMKDKIR